MRISATTRLYEFCAERNYTILAVSRLASSGQLHIYIIEHAASSQKVVARDTRQETTYFS